MMMLERALPDTVGSFLIDTIPTNLVLVEADSTTLPKGVIGRFKGKFGEVDKATNNGRKYPLAVMEPNIARLQEDVKQRGCFGELDHPADGRTKLGRVSHIITRLELHGKEIYGEADIVNTQAGRDLKAIVEAKGRVGVSSRGIGTTDTDMSGEKVVSMDYRLMTFDVVGEPATPGAFPKFVMEGREVDPKTMTSADLRKNFPDLVREIVCEAAAQVKADLNEEAEHKRLLEENAALKKALEESKNAPAKGTITAGDAPVQAPAKTADPEILKALEEAKAAQAKLLEENEGLKKQTAEVAGVARKLGYKYQLETSLAGRADAKKAAELVGDLNLFESLDALKAKITEVTNALDQANKLEEAKASVATLEKKTRQTAAALTESTKVAEVVIKAAEGDKKQRASEMERLAEAFDHKIGELRNEFSGQIGVLTEENVNLKKNLMKAVELAEEMHTRVYAEQKIASHPARPMARKLIESQRPKTPAQVNSLLESLKDAMGGGNTDGEFSRIQAATRRSKEVITESDETRKTRGGSVVPGSSWAELQALAGITPQ